MRCPHCGKTIQDSSKTCEYCGEKAGSGPDSRGEKEKSPSLEKSPPQEKTKGPSGLSTQHEKGKDDQKTKEDRREDSESPPPSNPWAKWVLVAFSGLILVGVLYFSVFKHRSPPPPTTPASEIPSSGEAFYTSFRDGIQETGVAKKYFKDAQSMAANVANPASMPAETAPAPQLLRAAENYARALERFKYAQQLMDNLSSVKSVDNREACRQSFRQILDRYVDASDIFSQNAKALSQGLADSKNQGLAVDGKAKYEMADQLMMKFLMDGCNGDFFDAVSEKSDQEKRAVLMSYQAVLQENFEPQKAALEKLFKMNAAAESAPP